MQAFVRYKILFFTGRDVKTKKGRKGLLVFYDINLQRSHYGTNNMHEVSDVFIVVLSGSKGLWSQTRRRYWGLSTESDSLLWKLFTVLHLRGVALGPTVGLVLAFLNVSHTVCTS